jgi:hypothetical protein
MASQDPIYIRRLIAHFPGFEPFDGKAHRKRYVRSAELSCRTFGFKADVGPLVETGGAQSFEINAKGPNWETSTQFLMFDHFNLISRLTQAPFFTRVWRGYQAAFSVLCEGGLARYLKTSWRFALFYPYPFLLMALGVALAIVAAAIPVWFELPLPVLLLSLPVVIGVFVFGFLPLAESFYMLHSMALWELAVKVARLDDPDVDAVIEGHVAGLQSLLKQNADEYLITTFSLGGAFMIHAFGLVLQRTPELVDGKSISIVTLGGPGLQSSLMKSATEMRKRVRTILARDDIFWLDVQCKYDVVNFYGGRVARDNDLSDLREPKVMTIRLKDMLTPENYESVKWDVMRVHRQFVYGSDKRSHYDFTLLTAGPFKPEDFAGFSRQKLPPLGPDGAILA